ncbi:hypothetical protein PC117_g24607 [Phytophthora cactorum]|uniref:Uncharacterized protein n=1 Tax=Phytophthora cactorum TaxID=29920 RepID=A0A8T1AYH4_9STRA|nr:hypothetical protein PC117_g24607 [Phytophthora cactorum]
MVSMMPTRDILAVKQKAKKKTRRAVFDLVTSTELVPQLKKAIKVLKSIGVNLKRLEKDYKPISSVYKLFLDLPSEMQSVGLTAAELKSVKAVVKVRFDCVYDDAHGLSYLLDRYMGEGMGMATRTGVEAFLESWYGDNRADDVILELTGYQKFLVEFKRKSKRRWQLLCDNKLPVYDFCYDVTIPKEPEMPDDPEECEQRGEPDEHDKPDELFGPERPQEFPSPHSEDEIRPSQIDTSIALSANTIDDVLRGALSGEEEEVAMVLGNAAAEAGNLIPDEVDVVLPQGLNTQDVNVMKNGENTDE